MRQACVCLSVCLSVFVLIEKNSHINHRHFIIRQLYKYSYSLYICVLFTYCLELRFVNFLLNEYCIVLYCIVLSVVCLYGMYCG